MKLRDFVTYCDATSDPSPTCVLLAILLLRLLLTSTSCVTGSAIMRLRCRYVFEPKFGERYPELLKDYTVPSFALDYLEYLVTSDAARPYYRWFLVGGKNSGFGLHQDPNLTSAWNACIVGRKR